MNGGYSPVLAQRVMRESNTSTTMTSMDGGIVATSQGSMVTLPGFDASQLGFLYNIKNASPGDIILAAAAGECLQEATGDESSMVIPSNLAVQIGRNGTRTGNWIVQ